MRGKRQEQRSLLMVGSVEERIAAQHPIRRIEVLANRALAKLGPVFDAMYAETGRPSVPPERLLKAQLLSADHFSIDGTWIESWASMKSFGWLKSFGGMKRSRVRGLEKAQLAARLAAAACNLLRLSRLQPLEAGT